MDHGLGLCSFQLFSKLWPCISYQQLFLLVPRCCAQWVLELLCRGLRCCLDAFVLGTLLSIFVYLFLYTFKYICVFQTNLRQVTKITGEEYGGGLWWEELTEEIGEETGRKCLPFLCVYADRKIHGPWGMGRTFSPTDFGVMVLDPNTRQSPYSFHAVAKIVCFTLRWDFVVPSGKWDRHLRG